MLHSLDFEVIFSSTGKTIKGEHRFDQGLTAITGRNEAGKSLRLEMIRYAIWGTRALRESIGSYKKLNVALQFSINGDHYNLVRTKNSCTLDKNHKQLVVGATPVNAEIERIFGYNMTVFDTANACLQGEVEALSNMAPADRKRMVDKVIGLDGIDTLLKAVTVEAGGMRSAISVIEDMLGPEPELPLVPENYSSSGDIKSLMDSMLLNISERDHIKSKREALKVEEPTEPIPYLYNLTDINIQISSLTQWNKEVLEASRKRVSIVEKLNKYQSTIDTQQLQDYLEKNGPELWHQYQSHLEKEMGLKPNLPYEVTVEEIDQAILYVGTYIPTYNKIMKLSEHLVQCPECSCEFALDHSQIEDLRKELPEGFSVEFLKGTIFEHCSVYNLNVYKDSLIAYEEFKALEAPKKPEFDFLGTRSQVMAVLAQESDRIALEKQLSEVDIIIFSLRAKPESSMDMDLLLSHKNHAMRSQEAMERYSADLEQYNRYKAYVEETRDFLQLLERENLNELYKDLQDQYTKFVAYEERLKGYNQAILSRNENLGHLEEKKELHKELQNIKLGLTELKSLVKMHLTPSLNRVASHLLSQMTNGERNSIQVDEDFNILVDGQSVNELSGSAKAAANLSIRIGLGTVLTSRVFSVLLADEIDAAMDDDRASHTAQCLRNLTKTFSQVILVSHSEPEADHYIKL